MRKLAFTLLISGFIWICFCQVEIPSLGRTVRTAQLKKLPHPPSLNSPPSYTYEDVFNIVQGAAGEMVNRIPLFIIPACIMLCGAIILDRNRRPK
jgi:hypothetical protein